MRVERNVLTRVAMAVAALAVVGFWVVLLLDRPDRSATSGSEDASVEVAGGAVTDADVRVLAGSSAIVAASAGGESVSYLMTAGRLLGRNVDVRAGRGSGFVAPGALSFRSMLDELVTGSPEVVIFDAGTDDVERHATAAQARAAALATLDAAQRRLPRAKVIVIGPLATSTGTPKDALALRDGLRSAARAKRVGFVDPIAEGWLTAENSAQLVSRGRLTGAGHAYVGLGLASALDRLGLGKS